MQRWALLVEYEGSQFHGWQIQPDVISVQSELQRALSNIAQHPVLLTCAGRTDAGVHACGQVVHFDASTTRDAYAWVGGANRYLPTNIRVLAAVPVSQDFHARFSALSRSYRYVILNRPAPSALFDRRCYWAKVALAEDAMQAAAQHLVGRHDFNAFRSSHCQAANAERTLFHLNVQRDQDWINIDLKANAFLHNMVRIIVGCLVQVGLGERSPDWLASVLASKNRTLASRTLKPDGLYFMAVEYPGKFLLNTEFSRQITTNPAFESKTNVLR